MTEQLSTEDIAALADRGMERLRNADSEGAVALFAAVVEACGDAATPDLLVQLARARNGLGFCQLLEAKKAWAEAVARGVTDLAETGQPPRTGEMTHRDHFKAGLRAALALFNQALATQAKEEYRLSVRGNAAYVRALRGERDNARALFVQLFADGGEDSMKGLLFDTGLFPVPEDQQVIALAREAWAEVTG